MAEVTAKNLYGQLSPMGQMYYDQQFSKQYNPDRENILLSSQPEFEKMKAVFEAEQQVPEKGLFSSLNPFGSASAAEPDKINSVSNTPGFEIVTNLDGTIQVVPVSTTNQFPYKSMAELAAANAISNPFQRTTNVAPVPPFNAQSMQSIFPTNVPPGINNTTSAAMFLDNAGLPAIDTSFGVANEPDVEQENKKSSGIADLFRTLLGFAVPGLGLLTRGLEGIKSLNQRLRDTDFARSKTGVEYFRRRRDRKAREDAAKRGALKQKKIIASQQVDTGDTGGGSGSSYDAPSGGTFGSSVNDASSFSDYS
jgi:hypothetical protein